MKATPTTTPGSSTSAGFDYDVALSFAGEDRAQAETLASLLKKKGVRVFYDKYEEADLWGKDLYTHLVEVYTTKARYCVMILSQHYAKKLWTNHERKAAQARAFAESKEYILPIKIDDTPIPGVLNTVGYVDLRHTTIAKVVELLLKKLT
ncbi:MAG: TIR domain-containing protein [Nannocystis sp.]|nr:TIR domain-containing protein [Nannocystis sp.]